MKARLTLLLTAFVTALCPVRASAETTLKLFIWEEYIAPEVVEEFTKETGIVIVEDNFDSVESALAKLNSGQSGYDVVVPSDYGVQIMVKRDLVATLDHTKLKNLKNLDPKLSELKFDPGWKHSVPYFQGTSGLAYSKKKVPTPPTSWADLFDETKLKAWKGRVSMLDDMRECAAAAYKVLGIDPNTTTVGDVAKAAALLTKQKPFLAKYDSASAEDSVASGETWISQAFSGDVAAVQAENDDVGYIIPKEGCTLFVDALVILKESKQSEAAHQFIDFLLRKDVGVKNVNGTGYRSCLDLDPAQLTETVRQSAAYAPVVEGKMSSFLDAGQEMGDAYEAMWTKLKN
jgi:spermidine/putrescine-binding protein